MRKFYFYLALAAAVTAVGGCSPEQEVASEPVVRPAKLVVVNAAGNSRQYRFPAIVNAATSADLTFAVSGQIASFAVKEGDEVEKGQLIAQLDQDRFRTDVSQARATLDGARLEFERAERLIKEDAIARNVFQQRRTQRDVAQAGLDAANKALEDSTLRSPFAGVIAVKQAKALEVVQPSQPIVTLQTTGAAEAVVQIPASLVAQSTRISPESTEILLDAAPGVRIPAEVKSTNARADEATQTFTVRFAFLPPDDLTILPGMTGTIESRIAIADATGSTEELTVPLGAVQTEGDAHYVWLVDTASMTVRRRDISVGTGVGAQLVVEKGLAAGDTIVAAGASYLHEGMKIRAYE